MSYSQETEVAVAAVETAARLCRRVGESLDLSAIQKADRSPVTLADFASQAVIHKALRRAFPDDPVVSEEEVDLLRENPDLLRRVTDLVATVRPGIDAEAILSAVDYGATPADFSRRYWTLDPIDGTKGFLRKDQYAIALALIEGGRPVFGVLGCPNYRRSDGDGPGLLFTAVSGEGTLARPLGGGEPFRVSVDSVTDPAEARFCESVEKAHAAHDVHQKISEALGIRAFPCRMDSQAKYAAVACGEASIYLRLPHAADYREKIWDHGAGVIIVTEAGGAVTDFNGRPLDFSAGRKLANNHGIVASNGRLHDRILSAIARQTD